MSGTIEIPFAIGAKVWWTGTGYAQETVVCPECAGRLAHRLILGNGEEVSIECGYCSSGMEGPRGVDTNDIAGYSPREVILGPVSTSVYSGKQEFRYNLGHYGSATSDALFADKEQCEAACVRAE